MHRLLLATSLARCAAAAAPGRLPVNFGAAARWWDSACSAPPEFVHAPLLRVPHETLAEARLVDADTVVDGSGPLPLAFGPCNSASSRSSAGPPACLVSWVRRPAPATCVDINIDVDVGPGWMVWPMQPQCQRFSLLLWAPWPSAAPMMLPMLPGFAFFLHPTMSWTFPFSVYGSVLQFTACWFSALGGGVLELC
jgi:hypothetical protein